MNFRSSSILALTLLAPLLAIAQWQVNTQVSRQMNVGGQPSVRFSTNPMTQRGATSSMPLPSEVRMAYRASGALPSEIRMNQAAIGPMAPSGAIAYIPPPRTQQPRTVTPGNFVDRSASPMAAPIAPPSPMMRPPAAMTPSVGAIPSAAPLAATPINGSIRYAPSRPSASALTPKSALQSANPSPVDASIRFSP